MPAESARPDKIMTAAGGPALICLSWQPILSLMRISFVWPVMAAALVLGFAPAAAARIGETPAECAVRYGAAHATLPAVIAESDPEAVRYERKGLGVIVHFRKGIAWHVSYAQAYISDPDRRQLLKENAETGEWEPPNGETIGTVHLWRHRPANLVACRINTQKINSLEVMTRECTEAFARARTQRHQEAVATMEKTR